MKGKIDPIAVYETVIADWKTHFPKFASRIIFYDPKAARDSNKEIAHVEDSLSRKLGQDVALHDQLAQTIGAMVRSKSPFCAGLVERFGQPLPVVYVMGWMDEPSVSDLLSKMSGIRPEAIKHDFAEDDPIFHEMVYHHELSHAQMRLNNMRYPVGKDPTSYEECAADCYAALRMVQKYGDKGLKAARLWLDARALAGLSYGSFSHYTSDALFTAIEAMSKAGVAKVQSMTPAQLFEAAADMANDACLAQGQWQSIDKRALKLGAFLPAMWEQRLADPNHIFNSNQTYRSKCEESLKRFSKDWDHKGNDVNLSLMKSVDLDTMTANMAHGMGLGRLMHAFAAVASGKARDSIVAQIEEEADRREQRRVAGGGLVTMNGSFNKAAAIKEADEDLQDQFMRMNMQLKRIDPLLHSYVADACRKDANAFLAVMSNPKNWDILVRDMLERQRENAIRKAEGMAPNAAPLSPAWYKAAGNDNSPAGRTNKIVRGPWSKKLA